MLVLCLTIVITVFVFVLNGKCPGVSLFGACYIQTFQQDPRLQQVNQAQEKVLVDYTALRENKSEEHLNHDQVDEEEMNSRRLVHEINKRNAGYTARFNPSGVGSV